ncbi:MAG: hypothetical protein BWK80_60790 [Desulfobacteraceae bacterium IS3]|nr:MAG: hypothetical protein BWK80_60790 [Desulfobacteraceae bacterium IS3]
MLSSSQTTNPFKNDIVSEPRSIEKSVSGLNDKPLAELLRQFEILEKGMRPRKTKLSHAQFVASPQPGYGKSHLIGRLFHALNRRATRVYLRPFEDALTSWKAILLKTVQELKFPDKESSDVANRQESPTQIETFAHGILIALITDAIENETISSEKKKEIVSGLQKITVEKFRKDEKWLNWIRLNFNVLLEQFLQQLQHSGISLNASPLSWLRVLFTYAYFPSDFQLRESCTDWLQGGSIDPDDAKQIGVRLRDIPNPEMPASEVNELCRQRIIDFSHLAGFFRPFLFCFDQTENYGKEILLAKTLGTVIQVLTDETHNLMTIVTANQMPWSKSIKPWWEDAHLNRLSLPLELEGLNQKQALELAAQRFAESGLEHEKSEFMGDKEWLSQMFQAGSELGVRDFLQRCSIRWQFLDGQPCKTLTIADCYKKAVEEIKTQPKRLVFDPNTLYWLVHEAAAGLSDLRIEKHCSPKGYFSLIWRLENQQILFGFESGSNWKRWESILRDAKIHYDANRRRKILLFRTLDLPVIPGPGWKKIGPAITEAKKEYLHILNLEQSEMISLYAAHDLYIDAGEGNIPFQRHQTLAFIREALAPFWEQVKSPLKPNPECKNERSEIFAKELKFHFSTPDTSAKMNAVKFLQRS